MFWPTLQGNQRACCLIRHALCDRCIESQLCCMVRAQSSSGLYIWLSHRDTAADDILLTGIFRQVTLGRPLLANISTVSCTLVHKI